LGSARESGRKKGAEQHEPRRKIRCCSAGQRKST
jgi:hypothetical protein